VVTVVSPPRVVWRLGGTRDGAYQAETFSAGTDARNLARADGFKKMVDAAGDPLRLRSASSMLEAQYKRGIHWSDNAPRG